MSTHLSRLSLVALALVALPLAAGCSAATADDGADSNQQNVSASKANEDSHGLRQLLVGARAGRDAERLGIARWDVFAGTSTKAAFEGAVFYASDDNGDVKVFFAFDNKTRTYAVGQLDRDGRPITTPLARATVDALFMDIADLRERVQREATRDCAVGVGVAALSGVLAAGAAAFSGVPAAIAAGVTSGIAVSGTAAEIVALVAAYVGIQGGVVAAVGVASSAVTGYATGVADDCRTAVTGVGGDAPAP